jgi:hypothetical protein
MRWIGRQRPKTAWCCDRCRMAAQKDAPVEQITEAPAGEKKGANPPSDTSLMVA